MYMPGRGCAAPCWWGLKTHNSCPGFALSFLWHCTLDFSCIVYVNSITIHICLAGFDDVCEPYFRVGEEHSSATSLSAQLTLVCICIHVHIFYTYTLQYTCMYYVLRPAYNIYTYVYTCIIIIYPLYNMKVPLY